MHTLTRSKKIWYIRFHALLISNIYYIITQTYTNWNAQMESKRCSKALENVVARFKPSQNNKTWWRWEHILKCKITSLQFITDIMKIHLYRALMEKGEKRKKRSITHSNRCRIYRQTCLKKKKKKRLVVVSRIKSDVPIFKKKKGKKQKLVQNKKILSLTHTHTHTHKHQQQQQKWTDTLLAKWAFAHFAHSFTPSAFKAVHTFCHTPHTRIPSTRPLPQQREPNFCTHMTPSQVYQ